MPFDRFDRFAHADRDVDAALDELVDRFAVLRAQNLERLPGLAVDADLDKRGLHPSLGEVTLRELIATWAVPTSITSPNLRGYSRLARCRGRSLETLSALLRREDPAAVAG